MRIMLPILYLSAIVIILVPAGCRSRQGVFGVDCCADIPSGAIPAGPGHHLCEWQQAQVNAASIDLGVFYQADFVDKSSQLGPAAKQQVSRLAQQGSFDSLSVIVEPSGDMQRDVDRTVALAAAFTAAGQPMSADQVQIASPPALGMDGFRAQQVARSAGRSGSRGAGQGGSGSSGFGGTTSGGFGGGRF